VRKKKVQPNKHEPSKFGEGETKKLQPAISNSTPDQPVPVGTEVVRILVWALSVALGPRVLPVAELCLREQLLLLPRRYPAPAQCGPTVLDLRHFHDGLDFCALQARLARGRQEDAYFVRRTSVAHQKISQVSFSS
jgi:hypothetical protein